jgi:transglutaminase-like putative cysteine protease
MVEKSKGRRKMRVEYTDIGEYLKDCKYVDYKKNSIRRFINENFKSCDSDIEKIIKVYQFVRDEISHSVDIQSSRITISASEVLKHGEGICYAKSNLFAALLRAMDIPAGFCYQRLTLGDTIESGYCVHALNAVYLTTLHKWIRLDARGNKAGINARFSLSKEYLAFQIREQYDEINYPVIYANPHPCTMQTLENNTDCLKMYFHHLPAEISFIE